MSQILNAANRAIGEADLQAPLAFFAVGANGKVAVGEITAENDIIRERVFRAFLPDGDSADMPMMVTFIGSNNCLATRRAVLRCHSERPAASAASVRVGGLKTGEGALPGSLSVGRPPGSGGYSRSSSPTR
jgi:hypothetical protein